MSTTRDYRLYRWEAVTSRRIEFNDYTFNVVASTPEDALGLAQRIVQSGKPVSSCISASVLSLTRREEIVEFALPAPTLEQRAMNELEEALRVTGSTIPQPPPQWNNTEAAAWQAGWEAGYRAKN